MHRIQIRCVPMCPGILLRIVKTYGSVKDHNLIILIRRNIGYGIFNAKTGHKQGRAAADTENHHKETFFITENVPYGNLV